MTAARRVTGHGRTMKNDERHPSSILELVDHSNTATRIVLGRDSLSGRAAVADSGLQLQVLGEIHVDFHLTEAGGALPRSHENAVRDVAPSLDDRAGALRPLRTRAAAGDRQYVEPQRFLHPGERVGPRSTDPAKRGEGGADLRDLQCTQLRSALAEKEPRQDLVLRQRWTAAELELRCVGEPAYVQGRGGVGDSRLRGEIQCRIDLAREALAAEADAAVGEVQMSARE